LQKLFFNNKTIKKFYPTYFSTVVYSVNYLVDFLRVYFTLHASNTKLTVQGVLEIVYE